LAFTCKGPVKKTKSPNKTKQRELGGGGRSSSSFYLREPLRGKNIPPFQQQPNHNQGELGKKGPFSSSDDPVTTCSQGARIPGILKWDYQKEAGVPGKKAPVKKKGILSALQAKGGNFALKKKREMS